ncbi:hypothetical protein CLAFUW4_12956 [Fulvia fulva]|uniref:Uncharacterized protein n=1 Tax=Passalora fulva TaxID=5499 RepID=A0A9Q8PJM1_PASFU|nr:uncharacterized protein CLAFUR5_12820 [Fulvia fulva]KAK4611687.1 hypothetical protein CLAFUR4_12960 [Fulvia fulva]UJO23647.1 hypothetical protein CLAFUR5_12820 [Fulvia fulva]WPV21487.1 hypothetical protein CLAFUW4_12956 [Fulvia fulva]WPV35891.1 hypothetical protein CLAFUW7_12963 [Fulvia fulva]
MRDHVKVWRDWGINVTKPEAHAQRNVAMGIFGIRAFDKAPPQDGSLGPFQINDRGTTAIRQRLLKSVWAEEWEVFPGAPELVLGRARV